MCDIAFPPDQPDLIRRPTVTCFDFKPRRSGSLKGFANVHVGPFKCQLLDVSVHSVNGRRWAPAPARPVLDRDGQPIRDDAGKIKYAPILAWDTPDLQRSFSDAVVEAVEAYEPRAFSDREGVQ